MSDCGEAEYEIESVLAAKVEAASRSRKPKLVWKYLVRWKGYTPDDDTWEPTESFVGSEEVIETFWKRASTSGRDRADLSLFHAGEQFRPIGPPRHKRRSAGAHTDEATSAKSLQESRQTSLQVDVKAGQKRPQSPETLVSPERLAKRSRDEAPQVAGSSSKVQSIYGTRSKDLIESTSNASPSRSRKRVAPANVSEIVPDSDVDNEESQLLPLLPPSTSKRSITRAKTSQRQSSPIVIEDTSPPPSQLTNPKQLTTPSSPKTPVHRARLANPRVKMIVEPQATRMVGRLSAKARAVRGADAEPSIGASEHTSGRATRSKPGPGRNSSNISHVSSKSSLLTAEKGVLKTIKRTRAVKKKAVTETGSETMDVDNPEVVSPPSPEELLTMAGLNSEAVDALPDFEDDTAAQEDLAVAPASRGVSNLKPNSNIHKESIELAKNNLFPPQTPSQPLPGSQNWGVATIFGPLSLGSPSPKMTQVTGPPIFLKLDSDVSIPTSVSNADIVTQFNQHKLSQQLPGKFYGPDAALSVLSAVRATGQSSLVAVGNDASAEHRNQFDLFRKRLEDGGIFVAMAGLQILVYSSTTNSLLSSRLNIPANMLNLPNYVFVSHVDVENYSGFADAASNADSRTWSQYISSS